LISVSLDQDTKRDLVGLNALLEHQVIDLESLGDVSVHDAHVHDAVLKHAVHCDVMGLELIQPSEDLGVSFLHGDLSCLFLHSLDHSRVGVLISSQATGLHLFEESGSQLKLVEVD
jgi:hypothetical protein